MSQLKTHQLAYRRFEREQIVDQIAKAAQSFDEYKEQHPNAKDLSETEMLHKRFQRHKEELLEAVERRIARLEA